MTRRYAAPFADAIADWLREDLGDGDVTGEWGISPERKGRALVVAKEPMFLFGVDLAREVFRQVDPAIRVTSPSGDGVPVERGAAALRISGPVRGILAGERTALNLLGRLSGVATLTRRFADALEGTSTRVTDTRKTTPGMRGVERLAVVAGGGVNHRMGLFDMVMLKENHIAAAGGVGAALRRVAGAREKAKRPEVPIAVEVTEAAQLEELRPFRVDRIMLDNMDETLMTECVREIRLWGEQQPLIEATGNMTVERAPAVAATGVDLISVGALTHSARCMDLSLLLLSKGDG